MLSRQESLIDRVLAAGALLAIVAMPFLLGLYALTFYATMHKTQERIACLYVERAKEHPIAARCGKPDGIERLAQWVHGIE